MEIKCDECGKVVPFEQTYIAWRVTEPSLAGVHESIGVIVVVCSPACLGMVKQKNIEAVNKARAARRLK